MEGSSRRPIELPLPVARLWRRSRNAKSAKDRHDTAFHAWEVSIRLAVAAAPPADAGSLRRASLGVWSQALRASSDPLTGTRTGELHGLLTEVGLGRRAQARAVRPRELLDALVAYRNRVVGHGSAREPRFYEEAGALLLDGLETAWSAGLFLPVGSALCYCESIAVDAQRQPRARLLDLGGETPLVHDPLGVPVSAAIRPQRLYLRRADEWIDLSPWLLYDEERERLYCFQALGRGAEYLDFGSGEFLRGDELRRLAPTAEDELRGRMARPAQPESEPAEAEVPGTQAFGDYQILGKLGEGGMGSVYLARQRSLDRLVALKLLAESAASDPVRRARFQREIEALSRCEHPSVVKILASGVEQGIPYYAMEYVEGADLRRVAGALAESGRFDTAVSSACGSARKERSEHFADVPAVAQSTRSPSSTGSRYRDLARFFRDAARGVQHLHERGIVHRDLSPANLMVTESGQRAVVMDLGLALLADAVTLTTDRSKVLGTLRYMPPEQLQHNLVSIDRRVDVYALGAVLYELLVDRPLFDGDTEARLMEQVLRETPVPLRRLDRRLPADLATIVAKAIHKDPGQRYESAAGLADDLEAFLEGRPIRARTPTVGYLARKWVERNRGVAVASSLGAFLLLTVTWWSIDQAIANRRQRELDSDLYLVADVMRRADEIKLPDLSHLSDAEAWIAEASYLVSRRGAHIRRTVGLMGGVEEVQAAAPLDRLRIQRESDYLQGAKELAGEGKRSIDAMRRRIEEVRTLERRSLLDAGALERWQQAITSISDPKLSSPYGGLHVEPQFGLLPLREDPGSGLWEFIQLSTGEEPTLDARGHWIVGPETGVVLVLLPGAETFVGAQKGSESLPNYDQLAGGAKELPVQRVQIAPFFLSKYELTTAQWEHVMATHGVKSALPAVNVSWISAVEWCLRTGLVLPTEAQWEYAARAGVPEPCWVPREELHRVANLADQSFAEAEPRHGKVESWNDGFPGYNPVDALDPNPFGLHSLYGNVWELCLDVVDQAPGSEMAVVRGGNRITPADYARASVRDLVVRDSRTVHIGFRPARKLER